MNILVRAPFLAILGGLIAAMALSRNGTIPEILFLTPLFTAALALLSHENLKTQVQEQGIKGEWPVFALIVVLSLLCGLRVQSALSLSELNLLDEFRDIETHGVVTSLRQWGRGKIATVDTPEGVFLVNFYHPTQANVVEGMSVAVSGYTAPLRRNEDQNGFNEYLFWSARGVTARLQKVRLTLAEDSWNLYALRNKVTRALTIHMPKLTSSYLKAAWTGQRDKSLNDKHRTWGTSHLLAVSGFHVGLVVMFFNGITVMSLRLMKRDSPGKGQKLLTITCLFFMWLYVILTGAAASALRAGLMVQVALTAGLLGRPNSALNSVSIAAVLLLLYEPFLFWDIGWRLSVLAAMTLTALSAINKKFQSVTSWLLMSPIISFVTFPEVAWTFKSIPLVGIVLNLFAPTFFAGAFGLASLGAILKFTGFPFSLFAYLLLRTSEGLFELWNLLADAATSVIPISIGWNVFLAWLGAGTLIFLLCRAIKLSAFRTALLVPVLSFAAFVLFL